MFDQDDDGIVVVLVDEVPEDEEDHAREAVKLCPSQALRLVAVEVDDAGPGQQQHADQQDPYGKGKH